MKVNQVIVDYINQEMNKGDDGWRLFPRILMKAVTCNSTLFTNLLDMSNLTDPEKFKNHNIEIVFRLVS